MYTSLPGNIEPFDEIEEPLIHYDESIWTKFYRKKFYILSGSILLLLIVVSLVAMSFDSTKRLRKLLIISIDGYKNTYAVNSSALSEISKIGSKAEYLIPSFPSKTFPNHFTIITGLYPEAHGIVSNVFYDPIFNETFKFWLPKYSTDGRWYGGDPLWCTAQRAGLLSAVLFWPGSEASINGCRPNIYLPYAQSANLSTIDRFNKALDWLKPSSAISLVFVYISMVDEYGHVYGPHNNTKMSESLQNVDQGLLHLLNGYDDLVNNVDLDVVIVSDHGMAELYEEKSINITSLLPTETINLFQVVENSPNLMVWPKDPLFEDEIFDSLNKLLPKDNFSVYKKRDIPRNLHYSNSVRIPPIIVIPKAPYTITIGNDNPSYLQRGNHGFDNTHPDMRGIFYAFGSSFRSNKTIAPIFNTELYQMFTDVLDIQSSPNNSTVDVLSALKKLKYQ